ncbi:F-box/LRR-repeat protein At3g26922-like [Carex rostrata]
MDGRDLTMDRISDLPDSLITQILSLLTTKEAVCTCILSKRWTDLWTSVDTLDFDYRNFRYDNKRFLRFIHGVLSHRGFPPLEKFKLSWKFRSRSEHDTVEECINHVVACMPQVIYIITITHDFNFGLPDSLFNCGSVKEMSLFPCAKSITLKNASSLVTADFEISFDGLNELNLLQGLPNVTSLRLYATRHGLLDKDIPNCPILNNLKSLELGQLEMSYGWNLVACFLKHSPNLKKLVLNFGHSKLATQEAMLGNFTFRHEFLEIVEIRFKNESVETVNEVTATLGKLLLAVFCGIILLFSREKLYLFQFFLFGVVVSVALVI